MTTLTVSAEEARKLILSGKAPRGLRVNGHLDLAGTAVVETLPDDLSVTRLTLNGALSLRALPTGLSCYELEMQRTDIESIPADLRVEYRLDLSNSPALNTLPKGLKVGTLVLRNCTALTTLPEGLDVYFLDISGCSNLTSFPQQASIRIGRLNARGCTALRSLPTWLTQLSHLDVSGCTHLTELPKGLEISSSLDLANTQIAALPESLRGVRLRWRDVLVNERIVFHPETITAQEVLGESNAELRRVMLERMGYEIFMEQAQAEVLDRDFDPGGERRLLRVPMGQDEPLVCVAVQCPSTARRYIIRVPPTMRTCRQAGAWIAGYDNPDEYDPIAET
jgi:hypothetical protein